MKGSRFSVFVGLYLQKIQVQGSADPSCCRTPFAQLNPLVWAAASHGGSVKLTQMGRGEFFGCELCEARFFEQLKNIKKQYMDE